VIVVDGSIPNFGIGLTTTPIRLTVKAGNVTAIEGGDQARRLEDLLRGVGEASVYNIVQLAVGLNPECRRVTGAMLNDHDCLGMVHIGIGTSANLGGVTKAPIHYDAILLYPTLRLDEGVLLEAGELRL